MHARILDTKWDRKIHGLRSLKAPQDEPIEVMGMHILFCEYTIASRLLRLFL